MHRWQLGWNLDKNHGNRRQRNIAKHKNRTEAIWCRDRFLPELGSLIFEHLEFLRRDWIHSILPRDLMVVSGLSFTPQMLPVEMLRVDLGWCTGPWRRQTRKYPLHSNFYTLCRPGLWLGGWRPLRCLDPFNAVTCNAMSKNGIEYRRN